MQKTLFISCLIFLTLLQTTTLIAQNSFPTLGKIVRNDARLDALLAQDARIEVLSSGFVWAEGPVWVKEGNYLLFSDVPKNTIYKWQEKEGLSVFLYPSGYTGYASYGSEPGSNGLFLNQKGELVACEHGDRRVSSMPLEGGGKRTLADNFAGKRFNSPNDLVQKSDGSYYFTDPPYGLPQQANDPLREIAIQGVYRLAPDGKVSLVVGDLSRPNGLAFSPDEKILYVAQSDPNLAVIMAYPVQADGSLGKGRVFFDCTDWVKKGLPGLPDGLRVDKKGNLFATGPGGVNIFAPDGTWLGRIDTGEAVANCSFGNDGSVLYITADMYLCRIRTKTQGVGF
ncbi:MAG: SMP-30/gluconolactonase/LRE family protein [Microscillaceae bacterium]|jgi:gluconolactonase|nr:SMP-30/gluconolactonase/LRE family protein [Microscillaceae bacterium]